MIVKIVTFFLIFVAVMAMFGRIRFPHLPGVEKMRQLTSRKCRACGRPRIGKGPCPCGKES
ncbi:MAG: hypothetical protein MK180_09080 [Rhodobacteraceae bacterium]|nr:hypothetical protein [Paracoccaceae bacterium]